MTVSKERWQELCRQAAIERDPDKLVRLCDEINSIVQRANAADEHSSPSGEFPAEDDDSE